MNLQTVSDISRKYGVSTRMLRYYEQVGLITSQKKEGYAYRVYDEPAMMRLQQVVLLRKLQIPVKQICAILSNPEAAAVIEIFKTNLEEIDSEITALSTIRKILASFVSDLEALINVDLNLSYLNGDAVLEMASSLALVQKNIKERFTMNELNQAAEVISKLNNVKVRVYLYYNGNCAEAIALYEKAFGIKAEFVLRYKDAPPENYTAHPEGTEDFVMHTWLKLGNDEIGTIGMSDRLPDYPCGYGDGMVVHVSLGSSDAVRAAFSALREGGEVIAEPKTTFFCECCCEVKDRFGVNWCLMYN